jgi:hypothetical protein
MGKAGSSGGADGRFGCGYGHTADTTCSATTLRRSCGGPLHAIAVVGRCPPGPWCAPSAGWWWSSG